MTDFLLPFINRKIEESQQHLEEKAENEVWVSELVECSKKSELRLKMPYLDVPSPTTLVGQLVHLGAYVALRQFFDADYEVEAEKEIDGIKVKGRIDAILKEGIVVEVKFMRASVEREPLAHHVKQLRLYLWLTGLEKGVLLYVTPDGIYEHEIDMPLRDEQVRMLLQDQQAPRYEWECSYCPWSGFCEKKVRKERR